MNIEAIKITVKSEGWQYIQAIFDEEILQEKKEIKTEDRRFEDVAVDTIAQKKAAKMVKRALSRINKLGEGNNFKKEKYI